MTLFNYSMVRYSTPALYTFELVVVVAVWVLVLWRRTTDPRSLTVYVIAGSYDSAVELLAQGSGVRTIAGAQIFGAIMVGYPVLPFILGFFEGGVLLLVGYGILRGIQERDRRAMRMALILTVTLCALISRPRSLPCSSRGKPSTPSVAPPARASRAVS